MHYCVSIMIKTDTHAHQYCTYMSVRHCMCIYIYMYIYIYIHTLVHVQIYMYISAYGVCNLACDYKHNALLLHDVIKPVIHNTI